MFEELFQSPEQEIEAINNAKLRLRRGRDVNILKLYPHQEELIRSIYENKCTVVMKTRQAGYTTAYLVHLVMLLYKCYTSGNRKMYEECNFVIVSPNGMMARWNEDFIKDIIYQVGDKEFLQTAPKHFKFIRTLATPDSLRGYPHREITELYFDEYEFFANRPDAIHFDPFIIDRVVGITSKNRGKEQNTVEMLNDFIEDVGNGDVNVMITPWYACSQFNKNLKWARGDEIIDELTIDREGNIKYRPFRWLNKILDGWVPFNKWRNDMIRAGLKKEEFLDFIVFPYERHEQNLPKFDSWS